MSTIGFLSLGEVAASFGWTTRFVERLASLGAIPGKEIDGQWHFRREDLVDWLDRKIQTLDSDHVADLEQKLEGELLAASRNIHIAERLNHEAIDLNSPADSKPTVLKELVKLADKTGLLIDGLALHASLLEREAIISTALPGGLAICHPRRPIPQALRKTLITLLRTTAPIPFGAEDGEKTQLFFLIAALDDQAHLYALARLTRVLRSDTLDDLFQATDPAAAIEIIQKREREIDGV